MAAVTKSSSKVSSAGIPEIFKYLSSVISGNPSRIAVRQAGVRLVFARLIETFSVFGLKKTYSRSAHPLNIFKTEESRVIEEKSISVWIICNAVQPLNQPAMFVIVDVDPKSRTWIRLTSPEYCSTTDFAFWRSMIGEFSRRTQFLNCLSNSCPFSEFMIGTYVNCWQPSYWLVKSVQLK